MGLYRVVDQKEQKHSINKFNLGVVAVEKLTPEVGDSVPAPSPNDTIPTPHIGSSTTGTETTFFCQPGGSLAVVGMVG